MATNWGDPNDIKTRRQKAIEAGYNPADVDKFISQKTQEYQQQQATLNLAEQGVIDITDVAKQDPILAQQGLQKGITPVKKLSEAQQKQKDGLDNVSTTLDILEKNFKQVGAKGKVSGGITELLSGITGGAIAPDVADYEALRKSSQSAIARGLAGETGTLTDEDIKRVDGLLPKVSDSPELAQRKLQNIRELIAAKGGREVPKPEASALPSQEKEQKKPAQANVLGEIGKFLFPNTSKLGGFKINAPNIEVKNPLDALNYAGDIAGQINKQVIPAAGELALTAVPVGKAGQGIKAAVTQAAKFPGMGAASSLINSASEGDQLPEALSKAAKGAVASGVTAGGLKIGGKVLGAVTPKAEKMIRNVFTPNPTATAEFAKNTGLKFEEEILKREGKKIAGMGYEQIVSHFDDKSSQANQAVDKLLSKNKQLVNKDFLLNEISDLKGKLDPAKGNVGQANVVSQLQQVADDLVNNPEQLTLQQLNNIKRQLQDIGDSAFGMNGKPSATSKAIAGLSTKVKEKIEQLVPEVKELNKDTQLYRLALNSARTKSEREANKISNDIIGKVLQVAPAVTGVGGFALGGPLGAALGIGAPIAAGAARNAYFSPEAQTRIAPQLQKILEKGSKSKPAMDLLERLGVIGASRVGSDL